MWAVDERHRLKAAASLRDREEKKAAASRKVAEEERVWNICCAKLKSRTMFWLLCALSRRWTKRWENLMKPSAGSGCWKLDTVWMFSGFCRKDSEAQREEQARQRHEEAHNQNQQNVILSTKLCKGVLYYWAACLQWLGWRDGEHTWRSAEGNLRDSHGNTHEPGLGLSHTKLIF